MIYQKSDCPLCYDKKNIFVKTCRKNIESHYLCLLCYCKIKNKYNQINICIYCGDRPYCKTTITNESIRLRNRNINIANSILILLNIFESLVIFIMLNIMWYLYRQILTNFFLNTEIQLFELSIFDKIEYKFALISIYLLIVKLYNNYNL